MQTPTNTPRGIAGEPPADGEPGKVEIPAAPRHATPDPDPSDAFTRFASVVEQERKPPSRLRRVGRALGRLASHEWTLAALGSLLVAVAWTWPTLKHPAYTIPMDTGDPTLQAWQMAWSGHIVRTDPGQLWHSNSFFPEAYTFAFSDTLLGYLPAGLIGTGFEAALIRYNIMYVLLHALAFFGAYMLARQLGSGKTGALVAGAAFAYAPWRLAQAGHMHVMSTGGIALALAMLARGHGYSLRHGYRPERRRPWWALAGWLVAAWQISLGFGIGLPFGYVLAGVSLGVALTAAVRALAARRKKSPVRPFGAKLLAADLVGGVVFAAVSLAMAVPYLNVVELHPYAQRSEADVALYSPPLLGFFVSPAQSMIWGEAHQTVRDSLPVGGEMSLLPGFMLYGLAFAGLLLSVWTLRQRLLLLLGVVVSIILAMGTAFFGGMPGYLALYEVLPGWDAIRTPGRLVVWTTLLLAILAAGAVSALVEQAGHASRDRVTSRPHPLLRLATLLPAVLVLVEGLNVTAHPIVERPPAALASVQGPMLVLPSDQLNDMYLMLWNTDRFVPMVNGGSGFTPRRLGEVREATKHFPDLTSITMLRDLGVKTVVVLRGRAAGTEYEAALTSGVDGLGIQREERDDAVVFTLS